MTKKVILNKHSAWKILFSLICLNGGLKRNEENAPFAMEMKRKSLVHLTWAFKTSWTLYAGDLPSCWHSGLRRPWCSWGWGFLCWGARYVLQLSCSASPSAHWHARTLDSWINKSLSEGKGQSQSGEPITLPEPHSCAANSHEDGHVSGGDGQPVSPWCTNIYSFYYSKLIV